MLQFLINVTPSIAAAVYAVTGVCYIIKKDIPWAMVWISYALANLGLILIGMRK